MHISIPARLQVVSNRGRLADTLQVWQGAAAAAQVSDKLLNIVRR